MGAAQLSFAQTDYVKQVITVSGGVYGSPGNKVTFGSYDPFTNTYTAFDSVPGNFTNDVVVDGNIAYMTADTVIYKYNIDTYQKLDSIAVPGAQQLAIYNDKLIISRGYPVSDNYIQIYDKNNFSLLYSDTNITDRCSGIAIANDKAYVAVNGAWPSYTDSGTVAIFDMTNNTYIKTMKLDTFTQVVSEVYSDGKYLYALSSSTGYIGIYDTDADTFASLNVTSVSSGIALSGNQLHARFSSGLAEFNTSTKQVGSSVIHSGYYAKGTLDTLNNQFYLTFTDYSTYGSVVHVDMSGTVLDSFMVGVSPQAIAIDYRVNNAPVAVNDNATTNENNAVAIDVQSNDNDPDADNLTTSIVSNPKNGTANLLNADSIQYTPNNSFTGMDSLVYKVCDAPGLCDTAKVVITVSPSTSVTDNTIEKRFSIYPNPAKDNIRLVFYEYINGFKITIIDLTGRTIFIKNYLTDRDDFTINITDLLDGVYFITFSNEDYTTTKKFIKN